MPGSSSRGVVVRYLIGGVLIGTFWYLNRGRPPWEEAVRTLAVFAALILLFGLRLRYRSRQSNNPPPVRIHFVTAIAAKAVLVTVAAVAQWLLGHKMTDPAAVVSIGLAITVALAGPRMNRHLFSVDAPAPARPGGIRTPSSG
jgi:peptidoglycan/LPS O-acetylase OafA/YrhL